MVDRTNYAAREMLELELSKGRRGSDNSRINYGARAMLEYLSATKYSTNMIPQNQSDKSKLEEVAKTAPQAQTSPTTNQNTNPNYNGFERASSAVYRAGKEIVAGTYNHIAKPILNEAWTGVTKPLVKTIYDLVKKAIKAPFTGAKEAVKGYAETKALADNYRELEAGQKVEGGLNPFENNRLAGNFRNTQAMQAALIQFAGRSVSMREAYEQMRLTNPTLTPSTTTPESVIPVEATPAVAPIAEPVVASVVAPVTPIVAPTEPIVPTPAPVVPVVPTVVSTPFTPTPSLETPTTSTDKPKRKYSRKKKENLETSVTNSATPTNTNNGTGCLYGRCSGVTINLYNNSYSIPQNLSDYSI